VIYIQYFEFWIESCVEAGLPSGIVCTEFIVWILWPFRKIAKKKRLYVSS